MVYIQNQDQISHTSTYLWNLRRVVNTSISVPSVQYILSQIQNVLKKMSLIMRLAISGSFDKNVHCIFSDKLKQFLLQFFRNISDF